MVSEAGNNRSCPGKCLDFFISIVCPLSLPSERRFNLSNTFRCHVLWGVLVAIALTTGLSIGVGNYHSRKITPVPDQMYYQDWFSNTFCDKVNLTSDYPTEINAYLLDRDTASRELCNQTVQTIKAPFSVTIRENDIYKFTLGLVSGDRVSGKICASPDFQGKLFIFTRETDFLSWVRADRVGPHRYTINTECLEFDKFDKPFILPPQSVENTGQYHFVIYNSNPLLPARVTAVFTNTVHNMALERRATKVCHENTLCRFELGGTSESKAICFEAVRHSDLAYIKNPKKYVLITCGPRLYVYMLAFLVAPIVLGIIGTVFICKCCKKESSTEAVYTPDSYTTLERARMASAAQPTRPPRNISPRTRLTVGYNNRLRNTSNNGTENNSQFSNTDNVRGRTRHSDIDAIDSDMIEIQPDTTDTSTSFNDPPPSYDEVMKGVTV